jgi:hypothetical protein
MVCTQKGRSVRMYACVGATATSFSLRYLTP